LINSRKTTAKKQLHQTIQKNVQIINITINENSQSKSIQDKNIGEIIKSQKRASGKVPKSISLTSE